MNVQPTGSMGGYSWSDDHSKESSSVFCLNVCTIAKHLRNFGNADSPIVYKF